MITGHITAVNLDVNKKLANLVRWSVDILLQYWLLIHFHTSQLQWT